MSAHKELQRLRELLSCHRKDHFDIDASELMELRIALDQAGHGIVILDKDLRSQLINQAFCNIWRLPLERARLHLPFSALMQHGRDTQAYAVPTSLLDDYIRNRIALIELEYEAPLNLILSNGETIRFQCMALPNGARVLSYDPLIGQLEPISRLGIQSQAQEIAPLPAKIPDNPNSFFAAMAKQHAIEQQHLFATAAAGIGTWSWNLITGELQWSDCYREILGLPAEAEGSDKLFLEGVHPFDRPIIEQNRKQIRAGDKDTFDLEYRILKGASRIERWINAKGRADRSHDGTVVRMRGIAQDITARKNAERERDELHHQLMQAQEQERKRLSHELHDQTGQSLVGTMLELREIESIVSGIAGDRLRVVRAQLELMSKKLHHLAWELRPPSIDELGLAYAIANYCSEWSALCGIKSDFHCEQAGIDGVPADIQTTIYRSIQECLTNVAKHASGAKSASIIIDRINTDLSVTIEDDGCGFDADTMSWTRLRAAGIGLVGICERLELVNGRIEIESSAGAGTTVFIRIPVSTAKMVARND